MFSTITKLCKTEIRLMIKWRKGGFCLIKILIIGVIIVILVLVLSVLTINKGYSYKHSVDKPEDNPYLTNKKEGR
ncbi:YtzI protein [Bacillus cereus]|uniref:YtzI protein n=1 Tax=Bacillus cereus TaxID=1396 RepID=A0AA44QA64_BACCE|nr:YtzI protein [Bacillus cereus]PFO85578.1 YtzI protein [Bacillus cereus]PFS01196.1 YtzI protein [Bacillus cereus]